jgi:hypothetical protein
LLRRLWRACVIHTPHRTCPLKNSAVCSLAVHLHRGRSAAKATRGSSMTLAASSGTDAALTPPGANEMNASRDHPSDPRRHVLRVGLHVPCRSAPASVRGQRPEAACLLSTPPQGYRGMRPAPLRIVIIEPAVRGSATRIDCNHSQRMALHVHAPGCCWLLAAGCCAPSRGHPPRPRLDRLSRHAQLLALRPFLAVARAWPCQAASLLLQRVGQAACHGHLEACLGTDTIGCSRCTWMRPAVW